MNTRMTAIMTWFCRSPSNWFTKTDLSCVKVTFMPSGIVLMYVSAMAFTCPIVSIRLAPMRFFTSMAMAGLPLSRVTVSASLKVARTVATSLAWTTAVGVATTGRLAMSCGVSISEGTLTAYLPCDPSMLPAATRLLDAATPWISWSSLSP